jgi:broad specificity phosphatase PhoE
MSGIPAPFARPVERALLAPAGARPRSAFCASERDAGRAADRAGVSLSVVEGRPLRELPGAERVELVRAGVPAPAERDIVRRAALRGVGGSRCEVTLRPAAARVPGASAPVGGDGGRCYVLAVTRILVVRHGQSEWNAQGRWQGQENPPLTDLGRQQARDAARAVGAVDAIYASPLDRAATTAHLIAEATGVGPVVVVEGLMERHAGAWQGMTRDEIEEAFPGYLAEARRPPGWEDDDEVEARVLDALGSIADAHPEGHVLAVAHAGVIFAIERLLGAEWERLANLGGRWVERTGRGTRPGDWSVGERVHLLVSETIPDQL